MLRPLLLPCLLACLTAAEDAWILAGQSNMGGGHLTYAEALKPVIAAAGATPRFIISTAPGRSVTAWLDPQGKDYAVLWSKAIVGGVSAAKAAGARIAGMVWYQGEEDSGNPVPYPSSLRQLFTAVRSAAGRDDLPIIVVQLATKVGYKWGEGWNWGLVRESHRRVGDEFGACIAAMDVPLGDYAVHVGQPGHQIVAQRIAAAARHLVYGGPAAGIGPRPRAVTRSADPCVVRVRYDRCDGELRLLPGWRQAFTLHRRTAPLGKEMPDADAFAAMPELLTDAEAPVGALAEGDSVWLRFATPVTTGLAVSCAPAGDAIFGAARTDRPQVAALADASAHALAFMLLPVVAGSDAAPTFAAATLPPTYTQDEPLQIGVNCIGKLEDSILAPEAVAGWDSWRQPHWNAVSNQTTTHLYDHRGRLGPVSFITGIWYFTPVFTDLKTDDDRLMAGFCKHPMHAWMGLQPSARYDVLVLLTQPVRKDGAATTRTRVVILAQPYRKGGKELARSEALVPTGRFTGFAVPDAASGGIGNVLVFPGIVADADGNIGITVTTVETGERERWIPTALAATQVRSAR